MKKFLPIFWFCICFIFPFIWILTLPARHKEDVQNRNLTNSLSSRYKITSVDFYYPENGFLVITVFTDTKGTNDYMFIQNSRGISTPIVVPKPTNRTENF